MTWKLTSRHSAGWPHRGFPSVWEFITEGQVPLAAALALNLLWFAVFDKYCQKPINKLPDTYQ